MAHLAPVCWVFGNVHLESEFGNNLPWDYLEMACPKCLKLAMVWTWLTKCWNGRLLIDFPWIVGLTELWGGLPRSESWSKLLLARWPLGWLARINWCSKWFPLFGLLSLYQFPQLHIVVISLTLSVDSQIRLCIQKMVILMQCLCKNLISKFIDMNGWNTVNESLIRTQWWSSHSQYASWCHQMINKNRLESG